MHTPIQHHFHTTNFPYSSKVKAVDLITSSPAVSVCTVLFPVALSTLISCHTTH